MPLPKTSRWLDLIAFLLAHRFPVTREQIYESVSGYKDDWERADDEKARESLRRKFERDKDELRELGVNVETVDLPDRAGDEAMVGYRLRPGDFYLPYLQLEQDPPSSAGRPYENNEMLELLQQAVARKVAVECRYYTIVRDSEAMRVIEPQSVQVRLEFPESRWVLAQGTGTAVQPITDDGGAVIEFQVHDTSPFLPYLLTFRDHVEILKPTELAGELGELRQRVAALYEGS